MYSYVLVKHIPFLDVINNNNIIFTFCFKLGNVQLLGNALTLRHPKALDWQHVIQKLENKVQ